MKLKAFTLLELLATMLITSLVVGTVYAVYIYGFKQFNKFTSVNSGLKDYFELSYILNREIDESQYVVQSDDQTMKLIGEKKTIQYQFSEKNILRITEQHTDTFDFAVHNTVFKTFLTTDQKEYVEHLSIDLEQKGSRHQLSFLKNYGAIARQVNNDEY